MIKKIAALAAAALTAAALTAANTAFAEEASTTTTFSSDLFTIKANNVPNGSYIILVAYKDGRFVDWDIHGPYNAATDEGDGIPLDFYGDSSYTAGDYNQAVVFVWDSAAGMHRVTSVEKVDLDGSGSTYADPATVDDVEIIKDGQGTLYLPADNRLTEAAAEGGNTILIARPHGDGTFDDFSDVGDPGDPDYDYVIYMGQTDAGYAANSAFYLKEGAPDGLYKVYIGKDGAERIEKSFYIGLNKDAIDIEMSLNESSETDGKLSSTYTAAVPANNNYRSVIMNIDGKYMGMPIDTVTSGEGTLELGIQITDIPTNVEIGGVWLSTRAITDLGNDTAELTQKPVTLPNSTDQ